MLTAAYVYVTAGSVLVLSRIYG